MEHSGIIALLPALIVFVFAIWSKRPFEALVVGVITGVIILLNVEPTTSITIDKGEITGIQSALVVFFDTFSSLAYGTLNNDPNNTIAWITFVCLLMGALINLLLKSGGLLSFGNFISRFIKKRKSALIATWLFSFFIMVDDYLMALTVGSTMKKITDRFKISRELLAYIVDSTAAPICVLVPFSTWAIFIMGLLDSSDIGLAALGYAGNGFEYYINVIPYILYALVAVVLVPLVAVGIVPMLGQMKKAEKRVIETGELAPPDSDAMGGLEDADVSKLKKKPHLFNFFVPIIVMVFFTIFLGDAPDAFKGLFVAVVVAVVMYRIQGIMRFRKLAETAFEGFESMLYPIGIIFMSFILNEINNQLGLTYFVIEKVEPIMSPGLLPVVAFIALALVTFATGSFWGVIAISLPIIVPLAHSLGTNIWLAIGSVISAGAFGSHACFYGDTTVLASKSSGCNNMAHAFTQLPYVLIVSSVASVLYIILGYATL